MSCMGMVNTEFMTVIMSGVGVRISQGYIGCCKSAIFNTLHGKHLIYDI